MVGIEHSMDICVACSRQLVLVGDASLRALFRQKLTGRNSKIADYCIGK